MSNIQFKHSFISVLQDKSWLKKIYKIFKNNWKTTLKTALTLLLSPLLLVPFLGFYIALVLVKILSNYIEIVNKNDCEVNNA